MFIGLKTLPIQKNRYVRKSFKFAGKMLSLTNGAQMGAVAVKIEVFYIRSTCLKMLVAMRPILPAYSAVGLLTSWRNAAQFEPWTSSIFDAAITA